MNNIGLFFAYLLTTAGVTYLVRMLPLVFFRKKIRSRFVRSFLYYVPYSVLAVMTVPDIFFSTSHMLSGVVGALIALTLSVKRRGLMTVAAGAAAAVLVTELILSYIPAFTFA